jgi:hypothetical protein
MRRITTKYADLLLCEIARGAKDYGGERRKRETEVEWLRDSLTDYDRVIFELMLHRDH